MYPKLHKHLTNHTVTPYTNTNTNTNINTNPTSNKNMI